MAGMPETIGRYRVVRRLGAGGMGEVFLAEDSTLKRLVALKILPPTSHGDEAARLRLVREAQAAATLDHPNVCAVYEVGEDAGRCFIAMQFVEGETLADRIARGPIAAHDALRIAEAVADALAEAHARGIVHRDVKPANVMLSSNGQVKVLDFGLAKVLGSSPTSSIDETAPELTAAGAIVGTVAYMSPEQVRGEALDARTDVFSLGIVLHEMLSGRQPFGRASAAETIAAVLVETPPPVEASPEWQRIIRKCLEKERDRRYVSARDLLVDLRNLERETISSPAAPPRARIALAPWVGLAAAVALAAIAGAVWFIDRRPTPPDASVRVLAILPLHDSSSNGFGDGISESVINSLSQLSELKVLGRTTTFRYRGADVDLGALRDLGVDAVVTGRVEQQGDSLIVQAELTRTSDGSQIWGQRYNNRRVADVFSLQEAIARDIAAGLRVELAGRERRFAKRPTENVEAYRMYVVGREHAQRRTITDLNAAVTNYRRAIALDERYALAWTGLTDAYVILGARGAIRQDEARRLAMEAAQRAMAIDPDLAEANGAFGQVHAYAAPYDFAAADRFLTRAIELNPGWAIGRQYFAVSLLEQGRLDEGIRELETARELDPLSGFMTRFLAFALLLRGDTVQAAKVYQDAASLGAVFATNWDAEIYIATGRTDEGLAELARVRKGREDDVYVRVNGAVMAAAKGDRAGPLAEAEAFDRESAANPTMANFAARIYAAMGQHDKTLDRLTRLVDSGAMAIFYKDQPIWRPIRQHPRFVALLQRMRVPN